MSISLAERIDAHLPQTQCTRCGYPRCHDYAGALAHGESDINRCPPGGDATIGALARLLGRPVRPPDPACGTHEPRRRAVIDEPHCIGCRKCLDVCPVDAIVGGRKFMHTVIAAECNGCLLCLPACPVDCIALVPATLPVQPDSLWPDYSQAETERWRRRTLARLQRLERKQRQPHRAGNAAQVADPERERIRGEIRAAVGRVREKRRGTNRN
jgi:electron transport complex protein RnfB